MNTLFLCYFSEFLCNCPVQGVMERISKTAVGKHNQLKLIRVFYNGVQNVDFHTHTGSYIIYNSFLPRVTLQIKETGNRTKITALFELQRSVKVLLTIFLAWLALMEIGLIVSCFMHQTLMLEIFIPMGMILFGIIAPNIGLFFSSKEILEILFISLTGESGKVIPQLRPYKHIE